MLLIKEDFQIHNFPILLKNIILFFLHHQTLLINGQTGLENIVSFCHCDYSTTAPYDCIEIQDLQQKISAKFYF